MMAASTHTSDAERQIAQITDALHDLCQPLTALACRLEIGQMQDQPRATKFSSSGVWAECLRECERMNHLVIAMQRLIQQVQATQQGRNG